ncbi:MAG: hypothetical protein CMK32_07385 [Porticoccaceae bacterium]|nr:hypothetical protein [Porticoccaceae bacterium]
MANDKGSNTPLPNWDQYLNILAESQQLLAMLEDPDDPASQQAMYQLMVKTLAGGVFTAFSDPDYPDLVPAVNTVLNTVGVNPDFVYAYTKIDGRGQYRLSGYRGDGLFLMFDFIAGGLGVLDDLGPSLGTLDIDDFTLGPNGEFDILLSSERPEGHTGDWHRLDPTARTMNMRQASYHWGVDKEARIAIERIDIAMDAQPLTSEEVARRIAGVMAYPKFYAGFAAKHIQNLRNKGLVNRLEHDDWAGRGGVAGQHYYQGLFKLEQGMALVLETELPETVRYWNVQLSDMLWNSVNWMNHQSSLNGAQAVVDGDGKFRAVISAEDPGVANWLDTGGLREGSMMLRWNGASSGPEPALRAVPLADLKQALTADTVFVTPEQRQEQLRERRRAVQFRRRW